MELRREKTGHKFRHWEKNRKRERSNKLLENNLTKLIQEGGY